eukprot:TRINITY_DN13948_c0_g1_i1.p2 TRINITY_DN13948_c0_g1~~TRINITY_DN13948_c0_g1_i1.p2  ORF type:complete len:950 (+),score=180.13 TRINITY_DN13948_c0_g1_i1:3150-5999(+)
MTPPPPSPMFVNASPTGKQPLLDKVIAARKLGASAVRTRSARTPEPLPEPSQLPSSAYIVTREPYLVSGKGLQQDFSMGEGVWHTTVFPAIIPNSRRDAQILDAWMDDSLAAATRKHNSDDLATVAASQIEVYHQAIVEISRQVHVGCVDRGRVLNRAATGVHDLFGTVLQQLRDSRQVLSKHTDKTDMVIKTLQDTVSDQQHQLAKLESNNQQLINSISTFRALHTSRTAELRAANESINLLTTALQRLGEQNAQTLHDMEEDPDGGDGRDQEERLRDIERELTPHGFDQHELHEQLEDLNRMLNDFEGEKGHQHSLLRNLGHLVSSNTTDEDTHHDSVIWEAGLNQYQQSVEVQTDPDLDEARRLNESANIAVAASMLKRPNTGTADSGTFHSARRFLLMVSTPKDAPPLEMPHTFLSLLADLMMRDACDELYTTGTVREPVRCMHTTLMRLMGYRRGANVLLAAVLRGLKREGSAMWTRFVGFCSGKATLAKEFPFFLRAYALCAAESSEADGGEATMLSVDAERILRDIFDDPRDSVPSTPSTPVRADAKRRESQAAKTRRKSRITKVSSMASLTRVGTWATVNAIMEKWQQLAGSASARSREQFERHGIASFGGVNAPLAQWHRMITAIDPLFNEYEAVEMFNEWSDSSAEPNADKFIKVAAAHSLGVPQTTRKAPFIWRLSEDHETKILRSAWPNIYRHMRTLATSIEAMPLITRVSVLHDAVNSGKPLNTAWAEVGALYNEMLTSAASKAASAADSRMQSADVINRPQPPFAVLEGATIRPGSDVRPLAALRRMESDRLRRVTSAVRVANALSMDPPRRTRFPDSDSPHSFSPSSYGSATDSGFASAVPSAGATSGTATPVGMAEDTFAHQLAMAAEQVMTRARSGSDVSITVSNPDGRVEFSAPSTRSSIPNVIAPGSLPPLVPRSRADSLSAVRGSRDSF